MHVQVIYDYFATKLSNISVNDTLISGEW